MAAVSASLREGVWARRRGKAGWGRSKCREDKRYVCGCECERRKEGKRVRIRGRLDVGNTGGVKG